MLQLLRLHLTGVEGDKLRAVNLCDGLPLTARWITETILAKEESK